MKSVNAFCETLKHATERNEQLGETNARGNAIYRALRHCERYLIDFADDFHAEGWEQYDTDQDAWYFGVWVNRTSRKMLTYAEGDWSLVECDSDAAYNLEIAGMNEFYREGRVALVITADGPGKGLAHEVRQDRDRFFISDKPVEPQPTLADVLRS